MILVGYSDWIDDFNGVMSRETDLLDGYLGVEPLLTADLILTQVLQGFPEDRVNAIGPNDVWAMDFVHDQLTTGRKIRVLTILALRAGA